MKRKVFLNEGALNRIANDSVKTLITEYGEQKENIKRIAILLAKLINEREVLQYDEITHNADHTEKIQKLNVRIKTIFDSLRRYNVIGPNADKDKNKYYKKIYAKYRNFTDFSPFY